MKYVHTTVHVKDLEKSLGFYHGLLGLPIQRRSPGRGPAFLGEEGQPQIELIGEEANPVFQGFTIGFEVDSLEAWTKKTEDAGYKLIRGPNSPNPTVRFSFFHDPDGIEIQLLEYVKNS